MPQALLRVFPIPPVQKQPQIHSSPASSPLFAGMFPPSLPALRGYQKNYQAIAHSVAQQSAFLLSHIVQFRIPSYWRLQHFGPRNQ